MNQTTHQAFKIMISTHDIHDELEVSRDTVLDIRKKINEHALDDPIRWGISLELMHSWLEKAGYIKISKTFWEAKS